MTKGCYTCRRRRIICDNGQPTCRKCHDAGKECLGYQKPLVWVKGGVASRGKMMGRSFDDVKKPTDDSERQAPAAAPTSPVPTNSGFGFFSVTESSSDTESPGDGAQTNPDAHTWAQDTSDLASIEPGEKGIVDVSDLSEELDTSVVHVPRSTQAESIPAPWGLVDPLLKDLSQSARFYLFHCKLHTITSFLSNPLTTIARQPAHG